ncbi:hypothetical protein OJAV_G00201420 [Oryzias javanicus]|uniref:Holocytochrome c-type synthase n=1 Tax=Oryzias javanicus TaxID=123683 RepID=A0A3S2NTS5_ORYJA|nr:hypothetical protein OJAV_G00201420 [Oryzias javanicus]
MGASVSAPAAPTVQAEAVAVAPQGCPMHQEVQILKKASPPPECPMHQAPPVKASPPSECPMHKAEPGPAHQNRAYEFVECPMRAAAGVQNDIDPANMMPPPNQTPAPDQPFSLSVAREESKIPRHGPNRSQRRTGSIRLSRCSECHAAERMALERGRSGCSRHDQHHKDPQPEQRAGLAGDPQVGGHACRRVSVWAHTEEVWGQSQRVLPPSTLPPLDGVRAALRPPRLDHRPLWERGALRHRLLRRRNQQGHLPVLHPGRAPRLRLLGGRVGPHESGVVALELLRTDLFRGHALSQGLCRIFNVLACGARKMSSLSVRHFRRFSLCFLALWSKAASSRSCDG